MPHYWLVYRKGDDLVVYIEPAYSQIAAALKASLRGAPDEFVEGHQLDAKTATALKSKVGRPLSRRQAAALLKTI